MFLVKPFGVNGAVAVDTPGKKCFLACSASSLIDVLVRKPVRTSYGPSNAQAMRVSNDARMQLVLPLTLS